MTGEMRLAMQEDTSGQRIDISTGLRSVCTKDKLATALSVITAMEFTKKDRRTLGWIMLGLKKWPFNKSTKKVPTGDNV